MKMFIAITFFALVAVALGAVTSVPPTIFGSLLRTKSGILTNTADRWDGLVQGIRGRFPFGSINLGVDVNPSASTQATATTTQAATAGSPASTSTSAGAPVISGTNIFVNCAEKSSLEKALNQTIAGIAASAKAIGDDASGLTKAYKDAQAKLTSDPGYPAAKKEVDVAAALVALTTEQEKKKYLEVRQHQYEGKLEIYAGCKD